jgi:hypothetical protein
MTFLQHIRNERARQREKKPLKRDVFNQISSLVRQYGLKENFLDLIDKVEDYPSSENMKLVRVRLKTPREDALFSLATKDEYTLTMSIIAKINNSYLKFAHSPEEILLCKPLYCLNPLLTNQKLMRYHFETLLLHERVKATNNEPNNKAINVANP